MRQRLNTAIIALGLGYWTGHQVLDGYAPTGVDWAVLVFLTLGLVLALAERPNRDREAPQQEPRA